MDLITLKLPGSNKFVPGPDNIKFNTPETTSLGYVISSFLNVIFYIAGFLMLFWFAWGVFQYIFAGGNKDALAKARSRIVWSIVGFIILALSFGISQYVRGIFPLKGVPVQPVSTPPPVSLNLILENEV